MSNLARTTEILERLVAFDTVSVNPNIDLIRYVESYLKEFGIESELVFDDSGAKANLFATIGPKIEGGIVLSGHTDVVPVTGQAWTSDPFTLTERDGKLLGRGTSDMKGFCAAVLAYVPDFVAAKPKVPIHIAFSYDEEIGCVGVRPMIDGIIRHLPPPRLVIVGEPTSMKVVNAHKGASRYKVITWGHEAHTSQPQNGVNAIFAAVKLLSYLETLREDLKKKPAIDDRFHPPYTTIEVGLIHGGTAGNIVPRRCEFSMDMRVMPGDDAEEIRARFEREAVAPLQAEMKARYDECGIEVIRTGGAPPLKAETGSSVEGLIYALAQTNETHAVSFATEAGLFQEADLPSVVCGPGSIDQAHKPDEFIELDQLDACGGLLERLAGFVSG